MRVHIDIYVRVRYVLVHKKWGFNNVESIKSTKERKIQEFGGEKKKTQKFRGDTGLFSPYYATRILTQTYFSQLHGLYQTWNKQCHISSCLLLRRL